VADVPRLEIPGRLGLMSNFSLDSLGGLSQQIPPYGGPRQVAPLRIEA